MLKPRGYLVHLAKLGKEKRAEMYDQEFNIEVLPGGRMPEKAHDTDADYDVFARIDEDVTIPPGGRALIPLGFKANIPPGWRFKIESRSGLGWKQGVLIGAGVIDAGYENEICAVVHNTNPSINNLTTTPNMKHGGFEITITPGMKIAQFAVERVWNVKLNQVENIKTGSERSTTGFGASGN